MKFIYYFVYETMHIVTAPSSFGGYLNFLPSECCMMVPPRGYNDPDYQDN